MTANTTTAFDARAFRDVMGHYPTGVAVVTGRALDGEPLALVVGTLSSVSLEPPLVSFMPMKSSNTFKKLQQCETWCINVLSSEQEEDAMQMARRWEDKLDGIDWYPSPSGDPILSKAISWIDVRSHELVEAGDHWIVICHVADMAVINPVNPLVFFQGGFGGFVGNNLIDGKSANILPAIQAAHAAQGEMEAFAKEIGCQVSVFAMLGEGELVAVFSATGGAALKEAGIADRIPVVPPIGDTVIAQKGVRVQERWLAKAKNAPEEVVELHRSRLDFIREHGYVNAFLDEPGSASYESMIHATQQFMKPRLTPSEERAIAASIYGAEGIDYRPRIFEPGESYNVAAIAVPIDFADAVNSTQEGANLTIRISQLPADLDGATLIEWVEKLKGISQNIALVNAREHA